MIDLRSSVVKKRKQEVMDHHFKSIGNYLQTFNLTLVSL